MTTSWGPLLTRILRVVDIIANWTEEIVEFLYVGTNGQVDKPLPVHGDVLAVYFVEGRLFTKSPQGWYITKAKSLKLGDIRRNTKFWCQCLFQPDIPPIPDCAVPWRGFIDQWELREKLTNRSMWIRLNSSELSGCSYYNLSDWIRAKRELHDALPLENATIGRPRIQRPLLERRVTKRQRRRSNFTEYIRNASASSESSSDEKRRPITRLIPSGKSNLMITTGKMCSGDSSSTCTTASSSPIISRRKVRTDGNRRYMTEPDWLQIRKQTEESIFESIRSKSKEADFLETQSIKELSSRLEVDAVYAKCMRNQDRYEGLSRAVLGILAKFDSILDSVEMLIPMDDRLRDLTTTLANPSVSMHTQILPFICAQDTFML